SHCNYHHRHLHSFPTRRSSDLSKCSHESAIGIADQQFWLPAADLKRIAVKETAIVVVKAESVARSQWNGAIGLTQEEQISVLDEDRKSTRLNSSHRTISYAVFC